jgi:hypothetical protein
VKFDGVRLSVDLMAQGPIRSPVYIAVDKGLLPSLPIFMVKSIFLWRPFRWSRNLSSFSVPRGQKGKNNRMLEKNA